ncbi:hypothetical protein PV396_27630 [Streptomyces sp. ME02-8801-2C]|uniref:hypothetical protein n=1 Tax=Streptomyces sp. ME02-8801-2C TaxID=3028680 RepID=UPI0029A9E1A3|nr:hypothetical protein [Streptomyces sp. ME02-8801-2C]MDX3455665.1 hypothetical protein [Streptomyces sp. ME02-8801-2C]
MESTPPRNQNTTVFDATLCVEELRAALGEHGITLPSLRIDLPGFAGSYQPTRGHVELGGCNAATARKLAAVLRNAAGR